MKSLLLRVSTVCTVFVSLFAAQLPRMNAGIIGPIAGQNTATVAATTGGTPTGSAFPPFQVPRYPEIAAFAVIDPESTTFIDIAYQINPAGHTDAVNVITPDTASPTQAIQGPIGSANGPIRMDANFTIRFQVDASGTMATQLPIEYPISYLSTAADTAVSFDVATSYSSQALGFLGVSQLHFARSGVGSSPLTWFGGSTLSFPALPPNDILTLSGNMSVMADGSPNGRAEIYVYGVPEPSTFLLGLVGMALFGLRRAYVKAIARR